MPERILDLYQRLSDKVEALDVVVKDDAGDKSRFQAEWSELVELVTRQKALVGDIVRHTEELASLSSFLQTHYEREKQALARELHDQLGGILTPAKMDLSWLQARVGEDPQVAHKLARLAALIDQGIDLKRRIIEDLRPSLLDHLGFAAAVQWYVDETCGAANIQHRVSIAKLERLSSDLEIALYRVVQECVTNVIRHANARNVELVVERTATGLRIAVIDDGVGIEDMDRARKHSHGLASMSERMRAIKGTLAIRSGRGKGTQVEAFLPIAA